MSHTYIKFDKNYERMSCPQHDYDGSITGHLVINVPAWFDEHPEERKRLGWIKHITHKRSEVEYDKQTQYLIRTIKQIDPYTIEDEFHVMDKCEEQLLFEEQLRIADLSTTEDSIGGIMFV